MIKATLLSRGGKGMDRRTKGSVNSADHRILKGLGDVLACDKFRLHIIPQPRLCERQFGVCPVYPCQWIGNGDFSYIFLEKSLLPGGWSTKIAVRGPEDHLSPRINKRLFTKRFFIEQGRALRIGGKINIVWSAVFYLCVKSSCRGKGNNYAYPCFLFKCRGNFMEWFDEAGDCRGVEPLVCTGGERSSAKQKSADDCEDIKFFLLRV